LIVLLQGYQNTREKSEYRYICVERKMAADRIAIFITLNEAKKGDKRHKKRDTGNISGE
jgi:hypothetical protein